MADALSGCRVPLYEPDRTDRARAGVRGRPTRVRQGARPPRRLATRIPVDAGAGRERAQLHVQFGPTHGGAGAHLCCLFDLDWLDGWQVSDTFVYTPYF